MMIGENTFHLRTNLQELEMVAAGGGEGGGGGEG